MRVKNLGILVVLTLTITAVAAILYYSILVVLHYSTGYNRSV